MASLPLFLLASLFHLLLLSSAEYKKPYHQGCPPFPCGKFGHIGFPFNNMTNRECGFYTINCSEAVTTIQLKGGGHWYEIDYISIYRDSISIIKRDSGKQFDSIPCESIESYALPRPSNVSTLSTPSLMNVFNCSHCLDIPLPKDFHHRGCGHHDIYYTLLNTSFPAFLPQCSKIQLPGYYQTHGHEILSSPSFNLYVNLTHGCHHCFYNKEGRCQINDKDEFHCSNAKENVNMSAQMPAPMPTGRNLGLKLGLGLGLVVPTICSVIFFFLWCRKQKSSASKLLSRSISDPYLNSDPEGGSVYFGVHVFSYKDLEEATNNFDSEKELGDGGFGTVYYGKLKDGREVAVKRLYEHNYKRLEHFKNEIEILTLLRHKNLVSLYGCTSRRSRELLLVYEYIPNGTVADHLHGDRAQTSPLTWKVRMSIAIDTAAALAYLHASDIVHRDVKTNNILLDNNFCVKVADFGLSRLFPIDVTHVSTAPQGTPGYVDPEYHQCYQLTSKSDVYSFGVVLVELISSMPAVDITRHKHEINLSNLAISKIQKSAYNELVDLRLGFDSDSETKRMTIAVAELAFQCLQQDKEMRPSMDEVLEELKAIESGNNESENEAKGVDGVTTNVQPPPSPECDEVGLLKRMKEHPPSPNTVTVKWPSSRSSTPDISG